MMVEIAQTDSIEALGTALDVMPATMQQSLAAASQALSQMLKQEVANNLSGQILQSKSGRLLDSVGDEQVDDDSGSHVEIAVDGNVPYAAILEYGGQTKAHIIEAAQGKTLAFIGNGKQMFLPYVMHPGSVIPEFAYMRTALETLHDDIVDGLTEAVTEPMESLA